MAWENLQGEILETFAEAQGRVELSAVAGMPFDAWHVKAGAMSAEAKAELHSPEARRRARQRKRERMRALKAAPVRPEPPPPPPPRPAAPAKVRPIVRRPMDLSPEAIAERERRWLDAHPIRRAA